MEESEPPPDKSEFAGIPFNVASFRRRSCTSKERHRLLTEALAICVTLDELGKIAHGEVLVVYHCKFCKGYHLGHEFEEEYDTEWKGEVITKYTGKGLHKIRRGAFKPMRKYYESKTAYAPKDKIKEIIDDELARWEDEGGFVNGE